MLITRPNHRAIVVIEPPHTGSTSFRRWAQLAFPDARIGNPTTYRHATAEEVRAALARTAHDDAAYYALVRDPYERAITMLSKAKKEGRDAFAAARMHLLNTARVWGPANRAYWPCAAYTHDANGRPLIDLAASTHELQAACDALASAHDGRIAEVPHLNKTKIRCRRRALSQSDWRKLDDAFRVDFISFPTLLRGGPNEHPLAPPEPYHTPANLAD